VFEDLSVCLCLPADGISPQASAGVVQHRQSFCIYTGKPIMDMECYRPFLFVNMQTESSLDHLKIYTLPFKVFKQKIILKSSLFMLNKATFIYLFLNKFYLFL